MRGVAEVVSPRVIDRGLRSVGLSRTLLDGPPIFVPYALQAEFAESVARQTGERHLGALIVCRCGYEDLDLYAKYVLAAPRLDLAFSRGIRALRFLQSGALVRVRDAGDNVVLQFGSGIQSVVGARHIDESTPLLLIDLVRHFLGPDWRPDWVELPHRPCNGDATLDDVYETPIRYGRPLPGIAIRKNVLGARNPKSNGAAIATVFADLRTMIRCRPPESVTQVLRDVLILQTVSGDLSEETVAARMGLGKRTLQRRLAAEGHNFVDLLALFRAERAKALLIETEFSQQQIAASLGYREVNSFRRAFRNWTGMTPAEFRANHLKSSPGLCSEPSYVSN
ncbi:AraC family transcriptional regulator [Tropicimonas sp. IMCC34043]|uniref:helix-turn-helix domain-containing protein n=1 Tax=Tropicimonas sp. IMCC34043 TaxID=2248760 RepID=UPI0018E526AC|nr:AraC family transcriptional regulator [Tropicimonas sp. IMCC34043]